ncbi:hypothetical protein PR048_008394 [Dryococelus australis]|uniref:Uncharacterized protein n=1 Tax=Dryococelus australis TaxID=614101 RepID=A0ABQ9HWZ4_9NEOP|nr:hypothetical protein PR048_008394 [Dryococelus australis]
MKRSTLEMMCGWILTSWSLITQEIIVECFKKMGLLNALDGRDCDVMWDTIKREGEYGKGDDEDEDGKGEDEGEE